MLREPFYPLNRVGILIYLLLPGTRRAFGIK
jgi:hypothetical protein